MPIYVTIYEKDEKITRGSDITARNEEDALDTVGAMMSTGQLPNNVQILDKEDIYDVRSIWTRPLSI